MYTQRQQREARRERERMGDTQRGVKVRGKKKASDRNMFRHSGEKRSTHLVFRVGKRNDFNGIALCKGELIVVLPVVVVCGHTYLQDIATSGLQQERRIDVISERDTGIPRTHYVSEKLK